MDLGLKNKNVLITGGSKGIGYSVSKLFDDEGANLIIVSRSKKNLNNIKKNLTKNPNHSFISKNLLKDEKFTNLKKIIKKKYKNKIDIIIHNVGGALGVKDILSSTKEWIKVWKFNVGIAINLNNYLIPKMKKTGGKIIHVSSISAITGGAKIKPYGGSPAYSCAKAFLNMYSKTLSREVIQNNINVSLVMPGTVLVENKHWHKMKKNNKKIYNQYVKNFHDINRLADPDEIAPYIIFLASKFSTYAVGTQVNIDGGMR